MKKSRICRAAAISLLAIIGISVHWKADAQKPAPLPARIQNALIDSIIAFREGIGIVPHSFSKGLGQMKPSTMVDRAGTVCGEISTNARFSLYNRCNL